jgi:hypothetical protein
MFKSNPNQKLFYMYDEETLKRVEGTWIGELLAMTNEEIQKAADDLPEIKNQEESDDSVSEDEQGNDSKIKLPVLLGEMNDYEKALNALFDKKNLEHKEICGKEEPGEFSPEHARLHELLPFLRDEMWRSISSRLQGTDQPEGSVKSISKGGKIFAIKKRRHPMAEMFGGEEGIFGGIKFEVHSFQF